MPATNLRNLPNAVLLPKRSRSFSKAHSQAGAWERGCWLLAICELDFSMANELHIKEQICEIGRRVYAKGFAAANDGNISYRLNDREIICTPTMMSKGFMKPEDCCKVDYEGNQLAGVRKRSSEILLHLAVYKNRPDVQAVVHCHPPHATAFAVAGVPIPNGVLPEVEVFLGEIPTAVYETPGTQKFADTIVPHLQASNTISWPVTAR